MQRKHTLLFSLTVLISTLISPVLFSASIQYTYDNLNRLIEVQYDDGTVVEYRYDSVENRTAKVVTTIQVCEGDFDSDGDVDGSDLAIFSADFGRTDCASEPICAGDLDNDGDADGSDLATFSADFGRVNCP